MLFAVSEETPFCEVFEVLNNELLNFLERCIDSDAFTDQLFSRYQCDGEEKVCECWLNEKTKLKFEMLYKALPAAADQRRALYELVRDSQNISGLFSDTEVEIPRVEPDGLFKALKSLTSHLFTSTRDLVDIKKQAGQSVEEHYQSFVHLNDRSQLCRICGTELMSQNRDGLEDDEQWRSDYDHLLCKDKYPIYSVHPGNFFPTCHICNSKAKGAKNLLQAADGQRRMALYPLPPLRDSCCDYATVRPALRGRAEVIAGQWEDPIASVDVSFGGASVELQNKIAVWEEVYQVPSRVAFELKNLFCDRIMSELSPENFPDFQDQLQRRVNNPPPDERRTGWRFWWQRLYEHLWALEPRELEDVWFLIAWRSQSASDANMAATFGV